MTNKELAKKLLLGDEATITEVCKGFIECLEEVEELEDKIEELKNKNKRLETLADIADEYRLSSFSKFKKVSKLCTGYFFSMYESETRITIVYVEDGKLYRTKVLHDTKIKLEDWPHRICSDVITSHDNTLPF